MFDLACFGLEPEKVDQNPYTQNEEGFTVAMILASRGLEIPSRWLHDPAIRNKYGYTVALYQARNGHVPDPHWTHDKYLRSEFYNV